MVTVTTSEEAIRDIDALPMTMKARRTGDWRIIFTVQVDELKIVRVAHRKDVYED